MLKLLKRELQLLLKLLKRELQLLLKLPKRELQLLQLLPHQELLLLPLLPLLSPPLPEDEDSGISSSDETTCLSPLELDFYCGCHYQLHHHHHHYCYPYLLYHILFDAAHTHYLARGTCMGIFHIEYFGYEHVLCWYAMATQQPPTLLLHPRSRFTLNEFKKVAGFLLFLFIS